MLGATAQITPNPKINKKSTKDVFINKIEITESNTVVYMQFLAKTSKELLKDYFEENPKEKEKFNEMNVMMRNFLLQQMMQESGGSTISIQSGSYLKTEDGKKFKFLKAQDIPVAPERQNVEQGKKYFFKVYFEKLPKGYKVIDFVESSSDKDEGFTFWNFSGISINNPAEGEVFSNLDKNLEIESQEEFRLFGKVLDAITEKPISAKIICLNSKSKAILDSIQTSKSGSYEFMLMGNDFEYKVTAEGYDGLEEGFGISAIKSKGSLQKDIYLEPNKKAKINVVQIEGLKDLPNANTETRIGEVVENEKKAFKLDKVYFNVGEDKILDESFEQLNALANYLRENRTLNIQIEGHTDNQGDSKQNKKLSLDRAYNVREYLIKKGIEGKRIKFVGYGDSKPVSENSSEEARKQNRRVEYKILE